MRQQVWGEPIKECALEIITLGMTRKAALSLLSPSSVPAYLGRFGPLQ